MLLGSSCVWLADDTGWGGAVRREERTGHSTRGGGREAGPGPVGCEAEQSGTMGHVKRVGRLEKDSHGTEGPWRMYLQPVHRGIRMRHMELWPRHVRANRCTAGHRVVSLLEGSQGQVIREQVNRFLGGAGS